MKSSAVGGGDSLRPITTTDRHFYSRTETLVFDERGTIQSLVPDLILSTPLKEDDNNDLTFEETCATSDYWFQSNNSAPTQHWGGLYTALKARFKGNKADGLASGEQNFQIIGVWGTVSIPKAAAPILTAPPWTPPRPRWR